MALGNLSVQSVLFCIKIRGLLSISIISVSCLLLASAEALSLWRPHMVLEAATTLALAPFANATFVDKPVYSVRGRTCTEEGRSSSESLVGDGSLSGIVD